MQLFGSPVIGESPEGMVLKWINDRICCHIPEEKSNPELLYWSQGTRCTSAAGTVREQKGMGAHT